MKRIISLLLATVMVLSLCACGSSKPQKKSLDELTAEDFEAAAEQLMGEEAETQAPAEAAQKVYKLGETITMMDGMIEYTVNRIQFCNDGNAIRGTIFNYWASREYEEGETALLIEETIEYKGNLKSKFNWNASNYGSVFIDYNDGYEFRGHIWYPSDKYSTEAAARFEPLSDEKTIIFTMRFVVPNVVETDTASPLLLKFTAEGWSDDGANNYYEPIVIQLR